jgi:hypothetical protein
MTSTRQKTIKLGNWFEEMKLLEETGIRYYPDPKDKKSALMTKDRCIQHTDQMLPRDYISTTNLTYPDPNRHPDFRKDYGRELGPREQKIESKMKDDIDTTFRRSQDMHLAETRKVQYSSTHRDSFHKMGFKPTLIDKDPSIRIQTRNADYSSDQAITYYTDCIKRGDRLSFPLTFTNFVSNPFLKSGNFSGVKDVTIKHMETHELPQRSTTIEDVRILRPLAARIINSPILSELPPGDKVRSVLGLFQSLVEHVEDILIEIDVLCDALLTNLGVKLTATELEALKLSYFSTLNTKEHKIKPDFYTLTRIDESDHDHDCLAPPPPPRINVVQFGAFIMGHLNPRRNELICRLFAQLAGEIEWTTGPLELTATKSKLYLKDTFTTTAHRSMAGTAVYTSDKVISEDRLRECYSGDELLSIDTVLAGLGIEAESGYGVINFASWMDYYTCVSAEIENNNIFEKFMRKLWYGHCEGV